MQALPVDAQKGARIRQFTAGSTVNTVAFAAFVNRQNAGESAFKFGRPGIFRKRFCYGINHKHIGAG